MPAKGPELQIQPWLLAAVHTAHGPAAGFLFGGALVSSKIAKGTHAHVHARTLAATKNFEQGSQPCPWGLRL